MLYVASAALVGLKAPGPQHLPITQGCLAEEYNFRGGLWNPPPGIERRTPKPVRKAVAHRGVTPPAFAEEELCSGTWGRELNENPAIMGGSGDISNFPRSGTPIPSVNIAIRNYCEMGFHTCQ